MRFLFPDRGDRVHTHPTGPAEVVFDEIPQRFCREVDRWDAVFVAAAWVGDPTILKVLASRPTAAVIVTKDQLVQFGSYADPRTPAPRKRVLEQLRLLRDHRVRVEGLPAFDDSELLLVGRDGKQVDWVAGVRCFGAAGGVDIHHKFAVFAEVEQTGAGPCYLPRQVWTGSFNFTVGSGGRCENAVLLEDPTIADAYLTEWCRVLVMSEPVPWENRKFTPEWSLERVDGEGWDPSLSAEESE